MRRRDLLAAAGAGMLLPARALGFGETSLVDIAEIELGRGTASRPNAWTRLLYEVVQTTSIECVARSPRVDPAEPELFAHPFCAILGSEAFAEPSETAMLQLERYVSYGGFLLIDDTSGAAESGFDTAVRRLCSSMFPTRPLARLPADHSIYRSFFLIDQPMGRVARYPYLEGVTIGNLTPLVYCRNDLSGALDRGADGRHRQPCVPGGEVQRREAVKLGINLVMYSLTANYKRDQAHVRQLMLEGRLE
jgi:hypothetical protein